MSYKVTIYLSIYLIAERVNAMVTEREAVTVCNGKRNGERQPAEYSFESVRPNSL